jgi:hypothetical protein
MNQSSQDDRNERKELPEGSEDRAEKAGEAYCEACEGSGVKVSSWQEFDAWQNYVEGEIDESTLTDKAQTELAEFARTFGKYLVIDKKDPTSSDDAEKKQRVKRANGIYRKLCDATGLKLCFFSDFITWSDYVEGKISEQEFLTKAKSEVENIVKETIES